MSCSVSEAIRQIEDAKDCADALDRALPKPTTWTKLASDGVSPIMAAKVMGCTVAKAIESICKANHQISRSTAERIPNGVTERIVAKQNGVTFAEPPIAANLSTMKLPAGVGNKHAPSRTALTPSCAFSTSEMQLMARTSGYYVDHSHAPECVPF